jgi:diacylglycerol kinase (ATP)
MKRIIRKFGNAFRGVAEAIRIENSFKFHFVAAIAAVLLGFVLKITEEEWALLVIVIGLVLVAEMFNTVVELMARMVTKEQNELARQLLDISAGAVLVTSFTSVIVGVVIFGGKLWSALFAG